MIPLVSVVIPVFNRLDLTRQCLEALAAATGDVPHEVIVVDNASTDGTAEFLLAEEAAGRVRAIVNAENVGFGRACNQGAAEAHGRYVLFLNNDTIPQDGWLRALVETLEHDPSIGMVGSRLLYPNDTIQHAGMAFVAGGQLVHVHRGVYREAPQVLEAQDFPCVTGACILLPREVFEGLGGFDTSYRFYVEDVDLCMRVWDAGLRVSYCPESVVYHLENASVQDDRWRDSLVLEGLQRLHERWAGRWPAAVVRLAWPMPLPGGPRHFAALAFADEVVERPELLAAYGKAFAGRADVTLVIGLGAGDDVSGPRLPEAIAAAGLEDDDAVDMLAIALPTGAEEALAGQVTALYTSRQPRGPLGALPRFDDSSVDALAALAA